MEKDSFLNIKALKTNSQFMELYPGTVNLILSQWTPNQLQLYKTQALNCLEDKYPDDDGRNDEDTHIFYSMSKIFVFLIFYLCTYLTLNISTFIIDNIMRVSIVYLWSITSSTMALKMHTKIWERSKFSLYKLQKV